MATRRLLFLIFTGSGGDKTRREEKWKNAFCSALLCSGPFWPLPDFLCFWQAAQLAANLRVRQWQLPPTSHSPPYQLASLQAWSVHGNPITALKTNYGLRPEQRFRIIYLYFLRNYYPKV